MMPRHVVAREDELPPGARLRVDVAGRPVLLLNIKGELFALTDTCPHRGGSLSAGLLTGLVTSSEPGEIRYERAGEILRCPWHQWEFDVRTGRSYCDPKRMRVQNYPVSVQPSLADTRDGTTPIEGRVEGRMVAETFPVRRHGGHIVVDMA
jgi:nitrite reductase/ring-hydroxylating ferredoxin subunit